MKRKSTLTQIIELGITVAFLWFALRPGDMNRAQEKIETQWKQIRHRISVWETLWSIRNLPETN